MSSKIKIGDLYYNFVLKVYMFCIKPSSQGDRADFFVKGYPSLQGWGE